MILSLDNIPASHGAKCKRYKNSKAECVNGLITLGVKFLISGRSRFITSLVTTQSAHYSYHTNSLFLIQFLNLVNFKLLFPFLSN